MRLSAVLLGVGLGIVGLCCWLMLRSDASARTTSEPAASHFVPPASRATAPTPVLAPAAPAPPTQTEGTVTYPDGSRWPTLNGVVRAPNLNWPPERPYSPIVGKRTMPNGEQWYQHADGTLTTTLMVYRSDLGREDAMSQVATPVPVAPLEPTQQPPKQ